MFLFRPQLLVAEIPPRGIIMAHYFFAAATASHLVESLPGERRSISFQFKSAALEILQKFVFNSSSCLAQAYQTLSAETQKTEFFRQFFPVPVREMTQLKMVLESTLYSCGQMKLEAFEQSEISSFTIDSGWTACLPFASLAMQITACEIASMLLL